jgi:hypothetical protein
MSISYKTLTESVEFYNQYEFYIGSKLVERTDYNYAHNMNIYSK